jgi:hypothetical protein
MSNVTEIIDKLDSVDNKLSQINNNEITEIIEELALAIDLITEQLIMIKRSSQE